MGSFLLNYFSINELAILEILMYFVTYNIKYRKDRITKANVKKLIPLSIISAINITLVYYMYTDTSVYIITSFVTRISVLVFSVILLKSKLNFKVVVGSLLTTSGIVTFKR